MDYLIEGLTSAPIYPYANITLPRFTNGTALVPRIAGKIALEEAVGSSLWQAGTTLPATAQIAGFESTNVPFDTSIAADIGARLMNITSRLQSMDASGIGYAVISLTSPGIQGVFDTDNATRLATAVNNEIYSKYVQAYPHRFGFFASVAIQDPAGAAAELERAVTTLGAKGALINGYSSIGTPSNFTTRYLDDPEVDIFWRKVSQLNVPIYLHPRPQPIDQQKLYGNGKYPVLAHAAYGFGVETLGHLLRLMVSGLFDRYPNVQIIVGHAVEGLPFLANRIDQRLEIGIPGRDGPYKRTIKYYLQHNVLATLAGIRRLTTLKNTIDEMGEDRVLYSVDYPYESNEQSANWYDGLEGFADSTKSKISAGNAERLLHIPPPVVPGGKCKRSSA